jgi:hypothetical protein
MQSHIARLTARSAFLIAVLASAANARADEVEDAIQEGLAAYKSEDYSGAASSLDYAAQLIRQKKGGELESVFPEPLDGWTADDASSEGTAAAMFGGGVTASRDYRRDDDSVSIQLVTDSPLLQGVMMMLSNPSFALADGGKLERINGQKGIVKYDEDNRSGDINLVVDNRVLVTVEGNGVDRDELIAYASAVDFDKLSE